MNNIHIFYDNTILLWQNITVFLISFDLLKVISYLEGNKTKIGNELILAGKLQLKKLQKKKPEKNSGFDGA